jgi:hypothetical protein
MGRFGGRQNAYTLAEQIPRLLALAVLAGGLLAGGWKIAGIDYAKFPLSRYWECTLLGQLLKGTGGWYGRLTGSALAAIGLALVAQIADTLIFAHGKLWLTRVGRQWGTVVGPPRRQLALRRAPGYILTAWLGAEAIALNQYGFPLLPQLNTLACLAVAALIVRDLVSEGFMTRDCVVLTRNGLTTRYGQLSRATQWDAIWAVKASEHLEAVAVAGDQDVRIGTARSPLSAAGMVALIEYYRDHPEARRELGTYRSFATIKRIQRASAPKLRVA